MVDAVVRGSATTNSFAYIHIGAKHMLSQAENFQDGQLYNLIGCLTFSAFTLEAYFNHFGALKKPNWDQIERKYSKRKKFELFCDEYGINYDFEIRPYSTIVELFRFRDTMAHGKSTEDSVEKKVKVNPQHPNRFTAGPDWMEYATLENAHIALVDVEKIINELHRAGGYNENPFNNLGGGLFVIQMI